MGWRDDGVSLRLYISETGDFVSLGNRTDYPFQSGGISGIPYGFTVYDPTAGGYSDINFTTAQGRFSISANGVNAHTNRPIGATVVIPVSAGYRYIMNVQAQVMEGKSGAQRYVEQGWYAGNRWGIADAAVTPWENVALYGSFATADNYMTITVAAQNTDSSVATWGIQYQALSVIAVPQTPPPITWHEVTCDIRSMATSAGRERLTSRYEVGQCSLGILNDSGEFTYRPEHPWGLRPGRFIKVEATYGGTMYPTFFGIIDGMEDTYTLDGHALMVLNAVDVSSLLSNQTVPSMSSPSTMQLSGTRFYQLVTGTAWHPSQLLWQQGVYEQRGITANGRTVRDELGLIADSEGGYFFANRSGVLRYYARTWSESRINNVGAELLAMPEPEPIAFPYVKIQFPGVFGNSLSTPRTNAIDATSVNLDLRMRLSVDDWSGTQQSFFTRQGLDSAWLFSKPTGQRRLLMNATGAGSRVSTADVPFANGAMGWVRGVYTVSTGITNFYTAPDSDSEPSAWTQLGSSVAGTAGEPIRTSATSPLTVGANNNGPNPMLGQVRRAIMRSNNVVLFSLSDDDAYGHAGELSFTSTSGHPMTVNQTAPNVILQDATEYQLLPIVDSIATLTSAPIVCTNELHTSWSRDRVINEVSLANVGGSAFTQINDESQKKYGPRTYQRMDFLNNNAHPEYLAERIADIMDGYTDAQLRVNSVSLKPGEDSWKWALGVFLNDLVRVRYQHPTQGWGYSVVAHVQGVQHNAGVNEWESTLALDDYQAFTYWVDSAFGGWDGDTWDDGLWDGGFIGEWSTGQVWSNSLTVWGP
jgi:hypothetical protein